MTAEHLELLRNLVLDNFAKTKFGPVAAILNREEMEALEAAIAELERPRQPMTAQLIEQLKLLHLRFELATKAHSGPRPTTVSFDDVVLLEAAIALASAPDWQPIEGAPRTGKAILVWCPERQNIYSVSWLQGGEKGEDYWAIFGSYHSPLEQAPTHWMPLPPPPKAKSLGQQLWEANGGNESSWLALKPDAHERTEQVARALQAVIPAHQAKP